MDYMPYIVLYSHKYFISKSGMRFTPMIYIHQGITVRIQIDGSINTFDI